MGERPAGRRGELRERDGLVRFGPHRCRNGRTALSATSRALGTPTNSMQSVSPAFSFDALAQVRSAAAIPSVAGSGDRNHQVQDLQNRLPFVGRD